MMYLARLPSSCSADAEPHWQNPWTLINSIFPLTRTSVFGRISLVQTTNTNKHDDDDYQWFARAVTDKQFLSFAVPRIMAREEEDMRIISVLPSSGQILAVLNAATKPAVFKFSPLSNAWEALPPMISPRTCPPTLPLPGVVIDGFFYAVGGGSGCEVFRGAERLDLRSNKWEKLPPMKLPHIQGKCFAMDGRLYVLHFPFVKDQKSWSADIFNPATNQWTSVDDFLPPNSKNFSLAVLKTELYMLAWSDNKPRPWIMRYEKFRGKWVFVDFVPGKNDGFYRRRRLCPVGNELWVVNCEHGRAWCGCDEVWCETSVWGVFKGPSFCPPELEKQTPQPHKFIHAYRIEGISQEPAWRTIPVFSL